MRPVLFLLLCCASLAQAADAVSVTSLTFVGKNGQGETLGPDELKMPLVHMANAKVAAKINDRLFFERFEVMAPEKPGKVLSAADHIVLDSIHGQDFSVTLDSPRVLTIAFDAEGCGAYCENYASYYSFDTRNGHLVTVDELLTPAGMRAVDTRMQKERVAKYKAQLAQLRTDLKASRKKRAPKTKVDLSDLEERIAMNEDCLATAAAKDQAPATEPLTFYAVELVDKAFHVYRSRCSNHASRALDDVGDVMLAMPYSEMRPYLTSYAKALLLNEGDTLPVNSPYGQMLRGSLGGSTAVTMLLYKPTDNALSGVYFYDKHRTPIRIQGTVHGNDLELTECDDKGIEVAKIKLANAAGHLQGHWTGKKEFSLELNP